MQKHSQLRVRRVRGRIFQQANSNCLYDIYFRPIVFDPRSGPLPVQLVPTYLLYLNLDPALPLPKSTIQT